jgi:hypothetical protein
MSGASLQYVLLVVCWVGAVASLVIFLESWLVLTRRTRLAPRKATATHGVVSVLVPLGGRSESSRLALHSILDQSYPFIELLLIHNEKDAAAVSLVEEFLSVHSHVPVRAVPVGFSIRGETSRLRALDQAQSSVRGSWILVLDPDVTLEECAIESALEFARTEDLTAVGLSTGIECRSLAQKLLAPSLEWFVRMIQIVDRGREHSSPPRPTEPFMLLHGHTQSVINKMNRLPGI